MKNHLHHLLECKQEREEQKLTQIVVLLQQRKNKRVVLQGLPLWVPDHKLIGKIIKIITIILMSLLLISLKRQLQIIMRMKKRVYLLFNSWHLKTLQIPLILKFMKIKIQSWMITQIIKLNVNKNLTMMKW